MSDEAQAPKRGVGSVIKERLRAGDTNEAALEAVKAEFPESATSTSTVSWYRNAMRKDGNPENIPTAAEAKKAAAPNEPATDPLD